MKVNHYLPIPETEKGSCNISKKFKIHFMASAGLLRRSMIAVKRERNKKTNLTDRSEYTTIQYNTQQWLSLCRVHRKAGYNNN